MRVILPLMVASMLGVYAGILLREPLLLTAATWSFGFGGLAFVISLFKPSPPDRRW